MPGGLALLAESPELVGAEPYVLANCRSLEIARKFLMMCLDLCLPWAMKVWRGFWELNSRLGKRVSPVPRTERYKQYASRHGQDAAGNPSGGNLFRGLYNIVTLATEG